MGVDMIADRGFEAGPVYLTDMERCVPAVSLSTVARRRHWRTLEYETERLSGTLLIAWPETVAPDVVYPLDVSGWHAISIGVWKLKDWYKGPGDPFELKVKLTDSATFSVLTLPTVSEPSDPIEDWDGWTGGEQLGEVFWEVADLTGQQLTIGQVVNRVASGDSPGSFRCPVASITYIKLVPLTDEEVAAVQADRSDQRSRRLFAHCNLGIWAPAVVYRGLESYRNSDFSRVLLEVGSGDQMYYSTQLGRTGAMDGLDDYAMATYRQGAEEWQNLRDQGIDPFQVAVDYIHDIGMECHAGYRVAGFHNPPAHDNFDFGDSYYVRHPEHRGVDRNGDRTPRTAYSYPEVREYVVSLLREAATEYPLDGVSLLYCRRPPLVEYESPVVEGFEAEYGRDPRELDERDPEWLVYRARTLTRFMREVRQAMDEIGETSGRRIQVSAVVMGDEEENLYNGIDLRKWVGEGLVDILIPFTSHPNLNMTAEAWSDVGAAEFFLSLTKGTSCEVSFNLMPSGMAPERLRRRASELYRAGAEGMFFWNIANNYSEHWNALRRLGHLEEIESWRAAGEQALTNPSMPVRRMGDWNTSYVTPG